MHNSEDDLRCHDRRGDWLGEPNVCASVKSCNYSLFHSNQASQYLELDIEVEVSRLNTIVVRVDLGRAGVSRARTCANNRRANSGSDIQTAGQEDIDSYRPTSHHN